MSLKGNTSTMPLADLLLFLSAHRSTGTLELSKGTSWIRLYFEKGRIISSGSSDPVGWLGHFLISKKKISEEQLTEAMKVQQKTGVMLGKILVMIGAVTEEELLEMLEVKCKENIFSLFLLEDADFEFFDQMLPAVRLIPTSIAVEPLVQEGLELLEQWKLLRQLYPGREICFRKNSILDLGLELEDPFLKTVYEQVDGRNTIADMEMHTHAANHKVLAALHVLKTRNLISVASYGEPAETQSPSPVSVAEIMEMGKKKLAFGKWEEAMNLFSYIVQHEPQNQEAGELLQGAEKRLIESIYDEIISPETVLKLKIPYEALHRERFSAEESFLIARMNGRWDLKSILHITPLREVDALRIIKRLLDRNIIGV